MANSGISGQKPNPSVGPSGAHSALLLPKHVQLPKSRCIVKKISVLTMYEYPHLSANSNSVLLLKAPMRKPSWGILITHRIRVYVLSCLHQPPLGITQSLPEGLSGQPLSGGVKKSILSFLLQDSKVLGLVTPFLSRVIEIKGGSCW